MQNHAFEEYVWLNKYPYWGIFRVGNFDARYFFGSKLSGSCVLWVCIMKLCCTPFSSCILRVPSTPRGNSYLNKIYQEPMGSWIYTLFCFNISRTPALWNCIIIFPWIYSFYLSRNPDFSNYFWFKPWRVQLYIKWIICKMSCRVHALVGSYLIISQASQAHV